MEIWYHNCDQMKSLFKDLKVVELASVLAGPSVGMFFAELGAEVIKIENKNAGGDVTRSWKLASEDPNHPYSAYYSSVNYGKQSFFKNLKNPTDHSETLGFIKEADVVIANFKSGDAEKLGLDFENLKKVNSTFIYGEITGFGKSKRVAYDIVLQAESGFLSMSGTEKGELCKMPVALIDLLAAHQLKEGILLAMLQQHKEKKAIKVSVSLMDTAVSSLANQATNFLMAKQIAKPLGSLHPNIAPYGELFTCKDGKQLVLAVASNEQFEKMCSILGLTEIANSNKFKSNQNRVMHREELADYIKESINKFDREDLVEQFIEQNVPAGAVRSINEVFNQKEVQQRLLQEEKEGKQLLTVTANAFELSH